MDFIGSLAALTTYRRVARTSTNRKDTIMDITDEELQGLKEGLRDIVSQQYHKKHEKITKKIEESDRRYREQRRPMRKDGRRFSQDTQTALDEHVAHLHETAAQMKSMAREIKKHADALQQHASDLTELYQNEGQGPAFATDSA